jgi:predicted RND superfamily exporter protein
MALGWMSRLEEGLGRFAAAAHRRPLWPLLFAGVLTIIGLWFSSSLSLRADLTELLPKEFESVQNVAKLKEQFGGMGYVVVVGRDADPEALRRFAEETAPKLAQVPGIRFVEHRRSTDFFAERALYYLSLDDLNRIHERLQERMRWERRQRVSALRLDEEPEPAPSLDFSDIEGKYRSSAARRFGGAGESYYLDSKARMVVLLAKPEGSSANLGYAKELLGRVQGTLDGIDRSAYGPAFRVELTGTFQKKVDQQNQITRDIALSSSVAFGLILCYLVFHFRSAMALLLNMAPVGAGLAWTYGFTAAAYGSVNLLTGFLGAILGGLGIEHGIHLLGRYEGLRNEGRSSEEATRDAFRHTGVSALVSALVAALTFASLALSDFRAFREFGVIAAAGMLIVVVAYILVLPPVLGLAARFGWKPRVTVERKLHSRLSSRLIAWRVPIATVSGALVLLTLTQLPRVGFNFDFSALEDGSLPSFVLDRKVNQIRGYSQTPLIVLVNDADERAVVDELNRRRAAAGAASTIDFVTSLRDLVPAQQAEKKEVLEAIAGILEKVKPEHVEEHLRGPLESFLKAARAEPFGPEALPASVKLQFQGANRAGAGIVLAFPAVSMSDGKKVRAFADEVGHIPLPGERSVSASGEAMVLADIIRMVTREAPEVLAAALLSVTLAMWLSMRSLWTALLCLTPTVLSILVLIGAMPLASEQFNYLNILIVPVLIGVTVDASVHLVSRLREEPDFESVYAETSRAIVGGLITSAVGFSALLFADHPGLNSIGRLANLGFAVNLLIMLLGFPALLLLVKGRRTHE